MKSRNKACALVFLMMLVSSAIQAESIDFRAQNIGIEFESYGSCPIYLVPGTDDYDLCQDQQRQYNWRRNKRPVTYQYEEDIDSSIPERRNRFNVRERYDRNAR